MKPLLIGFLLVVSALIAVIVFTGDDDVNDVFEQYGLSGLSTHEMVETLDRQTLDGSIIAAAILETELIIQTAGGENTYPVDAGAFYLSFAPYIEHTHPCHNHNLVTCRSELAGETVDVRITDADGAVLIDETVTLYSNGFYGVWLPAGIEGTIAIVYGEHSVTAPIATHADSGTCLTEPLQLTLGEE